MMYYLALLLSLCLYSIQQDCTTFNGGSPNQQNGNEFTEWIQFNDFILTQPGAKFNGSFWMLSSDTSDWYGAVYWAIYSDSGNMPTSHLFSGEANNVGITATGLNLDGVYNEYHYSFSFQTNQALAANTRYWLGLHNGPLSNNQYGYCYWETTSAGYGQLGVEFYIPGGTYNGNGQDHAFSLTACGAALNAQQICNNADQNDWTWGQGYYCESSSAFVQCWGNAPVQYAQQNCPAGTVCMCTPGDEECSNHGTESPCQSSGF